MKQMVAVSAAVILLTLLVAPVAAQCAMCRQALNSPEGQQLIGALRHGILVLLAAPFMLFGIVAVLALRAQRRRGHSHSEIA
jgi:hypothetical protein